MRGLVIAYGAGVATGILAAWEAGRRWERASWALSWAAGWVTEAVWLVRAAAGWIVVVALVLGAAGALVWLAL